MSFYNVICPEATGKLNSLCRPNQPIFKIPLVVELNTKEKNRYVNVFLTGTKNNTYEFGYSAFDNRALICNVSKIRTIKTTDGELMMAFFFEYILEELTKQEIPVFGPVYKYLKNFSFGEMDALSLILKDGIIVELYLLNEKLIANVDIEKLYTFFRRVMPTLRIIDQVNMLPLGQLCSEDRFTKRHLVRRLLLVPENYQEIT